MRSDDRMRSLLRPFERRAVILVFLKSMIATMVVAAAVGATAWFAGEREPAVAAGLFAAALLISAIFAGTRRPTTLSVARRIDHRANLQDLIVTAVNLDGSGMASIVRANALASLAGVRPREIYPVEAPAKWALWLAGAAAVPLVVVALSAPGPAEREQSSGTPPLALPAGGAASSGAQNTQPSAQSPPPAAAGADPVRDSSAPASAGAAGKLIPAGGRGVDAQPSAAGDNRLRLAATNAEADIAAGRVPVARRAIVARYFAALQLERKQPR